MHLCIIVARLTIGSRFSALQLDDRSGGNEWLVLFFHEHEAVGRASQRATEQLRAPVEPDQPQIAPKDDRRAKEARGVEEAAGKCALRAKAAPRPAEGESARARHHVGG